MYAIIQSSGHQYRVSPGETVEIGRLSAKVGEEIIFDQVLMLGSERTVAAPAELQGVKVSAKVVAHPRGKKVLGLKYKPKKYYRRKVGQREDLTRVVITEIVAP
ncbi:MAG: 50S ribosomal protein L21 [Chloroflexi bacterium]|nr:50S ribosomal protein L21 [Chloroflexota bacterium]